ncbi:mid1-interacting protein 1-B-like [Corythoichthys intestinalis]|uniref:mid1-interacting protein 1-B-like n=1 Tax=Corythoichthys intestinalis TaxID=161448 RepID=UPI0025A58EC6|nr:mid1-interacting protein 1-B-like [Corythoichthys intestinalis]XP_061799887.1 mid1-interacting protein 1-B-like [Nerophis lumbriciformis]
MMQQIPETPAQKNSLFNAMNRFLGAVNNMDQTVMVPSLLRDVPLGDDAEMCGHKSDVDEGDADMYSYYQLLKSIRRDIEWGLRVSPVVEETPPRLTRINSNASFASSVSSTSSDEDYEEDEDLQKQFQYHLAGLQGVLSKLTMQANSLTKRYNQSIGL